MKAYVDELPENCLKCIFVDNQKGYCDLLETRILRQFTGRAIGCPLKSLSEYNKQIKKEVCEEIRKTIFEYLNVKSINELKNLTLLDSTLTYDVITDKLNEIEQGE